MKTLHILFATHFAKGWKKIQGWVVYIYTYMRYTGMYDEQKWIYTVSILIYFTVAIPTSHFPENKHWCSKIISQSSLCPQKNLMSAKLGSLLKSTERKTFAKIALSLQRFLPIIPKPFCVQLFQVKDVPVDILLPPLILFHPTFQIATVLSQIFYLYNTQILHGL